MEVCEDLSGDGGADFQIAVCEQCAIDSETGQDVVDAVHGEPPWGRRRWPDDVIVP
jgi:hypothetical protein